MTGTAADQAPAPDHVLSSSERTTARGKSATGPLLKVEDVVKHFDIRGGLLGVTKLGAVRAVDGE